MVELDPLTARALRTYRRRGWLRLLATGLVVLAAILGSYGWRAVSEFRALERSSTTFDERFGTRLEALDSITEDATRFAVHDSERRRIARAATLIVTEAEGTRQRVNDRLVLTLGGRAVRRSFEDYLESIVEYFAEHARSWATGDDVRDPRTEARWTVSEARLAESFDAFRERWHLSEGD